MNFSLSLPLLCINCLPLHETAKCIKRENQAFRSGPHIEASHTTTLRSR